VGVFASLGSVLFGYDLGVIAEVIASSSFKTFFNNPNSTHTSVSFPKETYLVDSRIEGASLYHSSREEHSVELD